MFTKRRSDSQLPLSFSLGLTTPSARSSHSPNHSTHSLLHSPALHDPFSPTQPRPTVDRATLHQTLAATSELLVALDAARDASAKLAAAERALSKHSNALGRLFGAECEAVSRCLAAVSDLFGAVAEVDAQHASAVKQRYELANGIADKWFKRTAKQEKTFATDMTDLEAKVDKAHQSFAKLSAGGGGKFKLGSSAATQAIDSNNKYVTTLSHLTHTIQSLGVQHEESMAEQRERAVREMARIACDLAEQSWNNRIHSMRAAGLKVAEVKESGAWCTVGMVPEPSPEAVLSHALPSTMESIDGSVRGPRSMAPSTVAPKSSRGMSFSTEHSSQPSLSSGGGQYLSMAPLMSPTERVESPRQEPATHQLAPPQGGAQEARYEVDYFNQRPGTSDVSLYTHDQHHHPPEGPQAAWGDSIADRPPPLHHTSSFVMPELVRSPLVEALEAQVSSADEETSAPHLSPAPAPPSGRQPPTEAVTGSALSRSDSKVAKLVQRYSLPPISTTPSLSWDIPRSGPTSPRTVSAGPVERGHPSVCSCAECTKRNYRQREGGELSRKEEQILQKGLRTEPKGTLGRMFGGKRKEVNKFGFA